MSIFISIPCPRNIRFPNPPGIHAQLDRVFVLRAFTFYPSKYVRGSSYIIKGIKSGCEWRREKMLLFICIFKGALFTHYNFLIYIESGCE
ncbi:hypothetical protein Hanom_Chr09g00795971 [Helianthus anomalus]